MATSVKSGHEVHAVRREAPRPVERQLVHDRRRRGLGKILAIVFPVVLLALWELSSTLAWIDPTIYPSPSKIVRTIYDLSADGTLYEDLVASTVRILGGFAIGAFIGLAVGVAMGSQKLLRETLEPTLTALYVVPHLALLPIFFTIFGFGDASKIALVAVVTFFFVWIQTMESVSSVPVGYRESAQSFGVSPAQMFRHVILPSALPQVFVAMRMAMAVSVLATIAAEFVSGNDGLGYLIFNSRALFLLERTYAGIVVVAILGVILTGIITMVGRRLTPWESWRSKER